MDDILTIRDVAGRLKLGERTVMAMLADGELPGFKLRGQWRIRAADFETWLSRVAAGGNVLSVTADVLGPAPTPQPAPILAETKYEPRDKGSSSLDSRHDLEPAVPALTRRVSQVELHRRSIDALGSSIIEHGPVETKPFEARLSSPLPHRIRLYIFNATRPPGGRPVGEHKVQLIVPGQGRSDRGRFDQSGGRIVLLAGYAAEEDVFVLWDAGLYTDFAWSRNVQVKASTIMEAFGGKIAEQERRLRPSDGQAFTETVLACPPERLAEAIARRLEISRERMANG